MKVIFLDIDGVLNFKEFLQNNKSEPIDRRKVSILKTIIDKTGAVIVLSSAWRLWFDDSMIPTERYSQQLHDIFDEFGIKIYAKTLDFSTEEIRAKKIFSHVKAKEILGWLNENKYIDKYVVIDDLDLRNEEINKHLVRIDGVIGITEEDAMRIIEVISH